MPMNARDQAVFMTETYEASLSPLETAIVVTILTGHGVTVQTLAGRLFDWAPTSTQRTLPAAVGSAIRTYVTRARRKLEPHGWTIVNRLKDGYHLERVEA